MGSSRRSRWRTTYRVEADGAVPNRLLLNERGNAVLELSGGKNAIYIQRMEEEHWRRVGQRSRSAVGRYNSGVLFGRSPTGDRIAWIPLTTEQFWNVPRDWRSRAFFPSLLLTADENEYSFLETENKAIQVEFRATTDESYRIAESPSPRYCWRIRVCGPKENVNEWLPVGSALRQRGGVAVPEEITLLEGETQLSRTIDLDDLSDFRHSGRYRVQLIYSSLGYSKRALHQNLWGVRSG